MINMRKLLAVTAIIATICIFTSGCSKTNAEPQNNAKSFVESLYTVNADDVKLYNEINKSISANVISTNTENYLKLNRKLKDYMTDSAFEGLIPNGTYLNIVKGAAAKDSEFKPENVELTEGTKTADYIQYGYKVTFSAAVKNKPQSTDVTEEGVVQVNLKDSKVSYINRLKEASYFTEK